MSNQILVTGKNSQLGQSLRKIINNKKYLISLSSYEEEFISQELNFFFVSRNELDLTNEKLLNDFFKKNNFYAIINCAAYTSVDDAEINNEEAEKVNSFAVAQLAFLAKSQNIPLIHISTDFVFSGKNSNPYLESDETNPQNFYGFTKLKGENYIRQSGCTGAIIRTSWLYSEFRNNFVKTILNLGKKNKSCKVINDQLGCPTYSINLANLLLSLIYIKRTNKILNSYLNTYHYSDDGICSWYEFAKAIFELSKMKTKIIPVDTEDYPQQAIRPKYSALNLNKIKNHLPQLKVPHWRVSLNNCLFAINSKS